VKTTLSTGKRLADDEAARLLDAANGVPAVGNEPLREQIAEFAKAVTDGMGSMAKVTEFVEAMQSRGGGDVSEELIMGNAVPATGEIRTTEGKDWYSEAAKWLKSQWDESGATMQSLEEIRGTDALTTLWTSTAEFHERFDTIHDEEHPFIPAQYRAFMEEVAEFSMAVLSDYDYSPANLERELVDVIVVGMGLLMAHGCEFTNLQSAIRAVAAKNDAKTTETHAKDAKGKVARKTA